MRCEWPWCFLPYRRDAFSRGPLVDFPWTEPFLFESRRTMLSTGVSLIRVCYLLDSAVRQWLIGRDENEHVSDGSISHERIARDYQESPPCPNRSNGSFASGTGPTRHEQKNKILNSIVNIGLSAKTSRVMFALQGERSRRKSPCHHEFADLSCEIAFVSFSITLVNTNGTLLSSDNHCCRCIKFIPSFRRRMSEQRARASEREKT